MKIIELINLSKEYNKNKVLDSINYSFVQGKCYLVIGTNGSGKSTLIKLILSVIKPSRGKVIIKETKISYVPEKIIFPDYVSIYKFLESINCIGDTTIDDKIDELLREWKLYEHKDKNLIELSKGMSQKVLIIQAILSDANLYILDEPLNGLDSNMQKKFFKLIRTLLDNNKTVIISTHYKEKYKRLAEISLMLDNGRLYEKFNKVPL